MTLHTSNPANHLIHESSPYLLQHAHNPVDWYPWGGKALEKARNEKKLILVSIGYAACHWCHVMERESFEDKEVAEFMNEHFVCIKVDREERPDIDQIYMDAVQILTGRGGWPLNCVALPDGRPFYGGTYFQKDRWMDFLKYMVEYYHKNPIKASQQADQLTEGVRNNDQVAFHQGEMEHQLSDLEEIFVRWKRRIDFDKGGNRGNIKFALPATYDYLLQYHALSGDQEALRAVTVILDRMAAGGIYDQVGGGFARYSTDPDWLVPHFEKMLYDNAQLVSLYSHAYQVTGQESYHRIVSETLSFVSRELTEDSGGFYSSLDADSEGVEGKFYVWDKEEIEQVLGEDATMIGEFYQVTAQGNWEGQNILIRPDRVDAISTNYGISEEELEERIRSANSKLLAHREQRIRPALDDKILTAWNGMMLQAYSVAYRTFGNPEYLITALRAGTFILDKMQREDGGLNRNYKNGRSSINGFLDDYAFVISGFLELYQATFDESWLYESDRLTRYVLEHFFDPETGMFFYTSDLDPALVARKKEITDNVIPSSNSQMARNLYVLGLYFYREEYLDIATQMVKNVKPDAIRHGPYYANWDVVLSWMVSPPAEVAIVGPDCLKILTEWNQHYLPFALISGGVTGGSLELLQNKYDPDATWIYVCRDKVCQQPVKTIEEALVQMRED